MKFIKPKTKEKENKEIKADKKEIKELTTFLSNPSDKLTIGKDLKEKKKKRKFKKGLVLTIIAFLGILFLTMILAFSLYIIISSPNFDKNRLYKKEATVLFDKDGNEFARVGAENRVLITYEQLPQVLIDALIATEDSRFFQHNGFDAARFAKASFGQILGNSSAGGASTLTMQVIKNTYTSTNASGIKGLVRKFTDIYMAVFKLEGSYTKEEIIEFYLNSQWLGNDNSVNYGGIYGVEQASQYFFGKSVSDLNLAEASMIAGMFQNPTKYNPYKNPDSVQKRRSTVLNLMVKHGYITKEEKEEANRIAIKSMLVQRDTTSTTNEYQAFIDYVLKDVQEKTGINPFVKPVKIYTTLNRSVQTTLNSLEKGELYNFPDDKVQFGMAITSVNDGSIVAISGGRNYTAKGLNRATDIKRQPGSTAKILFDYGPYIEYLNGSTYSMFLDDSYTYKSGKKINNFDRGYKGLMTMRRALVGSRNIPALKAFQAVADDNIENIRTFVHGLGIDYGEEGPYESASIGSFDGVNPLQMSAAYASFGRGGYYIAPYSFTKVVDDETEKVYEYKYTKEKVMSDATAYMITNILVTAGKEGVGGNFSVSGTDIAAKGGTTSAEQSKLKELNLPSGTTPDHWNITYSPSYSIALWYGYDNLKEGHLTSTTGGKVRRAIMASVGKKVYPKNEKFKKPSSVVSAKVELETFPAQSPSACTPGDMVVTEYFKKGTEPAETSQRYSPLVNPTNVTATANGMTITLKWNGITTPAAIDINALTEHFNKYYDNHATRYLEKRINYNNASIGTLGYQVSIKNDDGSESVLGFTGDTSYTYVAQGEKTDYTFIVRSSYSIFKCNMSSGQSVNVKVTPPPKVEPPVEQPKEQTEPSPQV